MYITCAVRRDRFLLSRRRARFAVREPVRSRPLSLDLRVNRTRSISSVRILHSAFKRSVRITFNSRQSRELDRRKGIYNDCPTDKLTRAGELCSQLKAGGAHASPQVQWTFRRIHVRAKGVCVRATCVFSF